MGKNKILLKESFSFKSSSIKDLLFEGDFKKNGFENKIVFNENYSSSNIENGKNCYCILRSVPISKYDLNGNNRIYPKELWEQIQFNKKGENTYCLADHPIDENDDGSVKNIVGLWSNLRVTDTEAYADLKLINCELSKRLISILQAGGDISMSTVGFGSFLSDDVTVDPDSYEIVRLGDWVLIPSQNVKIRLDENKEKKVNTMNLNKTTKTLMTENNSGSNVQNKIVIDPTSVIISNLQNQEKQLLREFKKSKTIQDKKDLRNKTNDFLETIPEPFTNENFPNLLENQKSLNIDIKTYLKENKLKKENQIKTLTEKTKKADKVLEVFKNKLEENKKNTIKRNKINSHKKIDTLNEKVKILEDRKNVAKLATSAIKQKKTLEETLSKTLKQKKVQDLQEKISILEDRKKMLKMLKNSLQKNNLQKRLHELKYKAAVTPKYKNNSKTPKANVNPSIGWNPLSTKELSMYDDEYTEKRKVKQELDYSNVGNSTALLPQRKMVSFKEKLNSINNQFEVPFSTTDPEKEFFESPTGQNQFFNSVEQSPLQSLRESQVVHKSMFNNKNKVKRDIQNYFLESCAKYPGLENIKGAVSQCKSLLEATSLVKHYLSNDEEHIF